MKEGIICVVHVDDTIFASLSGGVLEAEIANLGIGSERKVHSFQLRNKSEVGNFLGIMIKRAGPSEFSLSQPGLIEKVLKVTGMSDANGIHTPTIGAPVGADLYKLDFKEDWKNVSIVGMLINLAAINKPVLHIKYIKWQVARFTHIPASNRMV